MRRSSLADRLEGRRRPRIVRGVKRDVEEDQTAVDWSTNPLLLLLDHIKDFEPFLQRIVGEKKQTRNPSLTAVFRFSLHCVFFPLMPSNLSERFTFFFFLSYLSPRLDSLQALQFVPRLLAFFILRRALLLFLFFLVTRTVRRTNRSGHAGAPHQNQCFTRKEKLESLYFLLKGCLLLSCKYSK